MDDYHKHEHLHCWESENPPCGQKIKHFKCCLCEELHPEIPASLIPFHRKEKKTILPIEERIAKAKQLRDQGLSYDKIAKELGYRSGESVAYYFRKKK